LLRQDSGHFWSNQWLAADKELKFVRAEIAGLRRECNEQETELASLRSADPSGDLAMTNKAEAALASPQPEAGARGEAIYTGEKPTIYELEAILEQQGNDAIAINPDGSITTVSAPSPSPEAAPPRITLPSMTPEQKAYFRDLHERHVSYDPATIIGDPEAERKRLEAKAAPPSATDVAKAKKLVGKIGWHARAGDFTAAVKLCVAALDAARQAGAREGREQVSPIAIDAIQFAHSWIAGLPGRMPVSFEDKRAAQEALEDAKARIRALAPDPKEKRDE
jgi:hypothetical protein